MKSTKMLIITFFAIGLHACMDDSGSIFPELGQNIEEFKEALLDKEPYMILVNNSDFKKAKEVLIDGVVYVCAVDEDEVIRFIMTRDEKFVSPEGFAVGDSFEKIYKEGGGELQDERGFARYIVLKSGWNASFAITNFDKVEPKIEDSNVNFFFKRELNSRLKLEK